MLTIKVLGPGCENCKKVESVARKALMMLGAEAKVIKVTEYRRDHEISHPGNPRPGRE